MSLIKTKFAQPYLALTKATGKAIWPTDEVYHNWHLYVGAYGVFTVILYERMFSVIKTQLELCSGCKRCDEQCPIEGANVIYQDEAGNTKVKVDDSKCVSCGRCIGVCQHGARRHENDT